MLRVVSMAILAAPFRLALELNTKKATLTLCHAGCLAKAPSLPKPDYHHKKENYAGAERNRKFHAGDERESQLAFAN